ncbi:MAG: protein kinase domain-containing protein [Nannocystales bacterium]
MTDVPPPTPPASLEDAMLGVVLAERYRIDGVLGEGGMALVFHGHHLGLDRAIAIKVLKPAFVSDAQVRARFEQEARAVSRLEHVGIVKMYDVGTAEVPRLDTPVAFLVMERLRGAELSDLLRKDGPAPAPVAMGWLEEMLAAIAHAHARGVVHRDLKPENVFACDVPEGGRILKLVDFGIAKMVQASGDAPLTQMGMIFGTPAYMSPEQATGHPVDGRTDLYSAGIILFEMLSGAVPFAAKNVMEVLRQHVREPPPELPVAPPVSKVLRRLLAKSPDDRYEDAAAALLAVQQARAELRRHGGLRTPTMPRAADSEGADSPTVAAVSPEATSVEPAAPTAAALVVPAKETRARIEPPDDEPSSPPARSSLPFGLQRRPIVGIAVGATALVGLLAARSMWSTSPSAAASEDVAVGLPASRAEASALAAVDAKLAAGARTQARSLLAPLLGAFPDDPAVVWRAALAEGKRGRYSQPRAELLLRTLELDPKRIHDAEVQAFIVGELERSVVPDTLLGLVLTHGDPMLEDWTRALLGSRRTALPYEQRERLLAALRDTGATAETWDPIEHRCLDLWQAGTTDRPCRLYGATLDSMEAAPSASYRKTLRAAEVPAPGADETEAECTDLNDRRDAVLDALSDAPGDPEFVPRGYAAPAKASKRKSKKRFRIRNILR